MQGLLAAANGSLGTQNNPPFGGLLIYLGPLVLWKDDKDQTAVPVEGMIFGCVWGHIKYRR